MTAIRGRVYVVGDNIDTDQIIPAEYLNLVPTIPEEYKKLGSYAMAGMPLAADQPPFVPPGAMETPYRIVIAGKNFGCGSSREHAPQAIRRWGVQAIVGESFAEIFFGNSMAIGLPCVTATPDDVRTLMTLVEQEPQTAITIDLAAGTCEAGPVRCRVMLPSNVRDAFASGAWDTTGLLLDDYDEVNETAARLPYIRGF
jgi:3-isopropylmalate/(R)-2-methylmalate dehydratase small subunit